MDARGVDGKSSNRNDRVVADSGAGGSFIHGLFQVPVMRGLAFVALVHHGGLGVLSVEVSIRSRGAEGVVGEPGRHEQDAS